VSVVELDVDLVRELVGARADLCFIVRDLQTTTTTTTATTTRTTPPLTPSRHTGSGAAVSDHDALQVDLAGTSLGSLVDLIASISSSTRVNARTAMARVGT
jgi:hypothetical protein